MAWLHLPQERIANISSAVGDTSTWRRPMPRARAEVRTDNSDYYSTTGGTMDIKYQSVPTASFSRITLSSSDNYPYSVAWDDVEVTTTFAEAMTIPAPEPSSVSLVLLGFGGC
ncbi:MAG: hypothetical protein QM796_10930 [Chthoniobacteraceae bacterium]